MNKIFLGLLLVVIVGCTITPTPTPISPVVNETNETPTETPPPTVPIANPHFGNLTMFVINVGQGDSTFILTPSNQTILIDGGKKTEGEKVVTFIRNLGLNKIDYVMATHPDADHIGGLSNVIDKFKPNKVFDNGLSKDTNIYKEYYSYAQPVQEIIGHDRILNLGDKVVAEFIVPYDDGEGFRSDMNDNSILFKIRMGKISFLITGDCCENCETRITDSDISAQILRVGHHGACECSTMFFLNEVSPETSLISVGDNSYGHPCPETVARLGTHGSVYTTQDAGNIVVTTDGTDYSMEFVK